MIRYSSTAAVLMLSITFGHAEGPKPKLALKGLDPVHLVQGQSMAGLDSITAVDGQFEYRFTTPENKKAFEAKPADYRIQFNGACGKMGPFSGQGSPERYFVHNRRIYLFASEMCRDAFKSDPEKYIDRPNAVPEGTKEQRQQGMKLIVTALAGFGGVAKVDGLNSLQTTIKHVYKQGDKETPSVKRVYWAFPTRFRLEEVFTKAHGFAVNGANAIEFSGEEIQSLSSEMRDVAWRQALREPLAVLKNRNAEGFVAVAKGASQVGDVPVELVAVALNGATSIWSIDPKTGRILQVRFEARRGTIGDNVVTYGDFRNVDGLILPYRRSLAFNGKEVKSPTATIEKIVVNGELKAELFAPK